MAMRNDVLEEAAKVLDELLMAAELLDNADSQCRIWWCQGTLDAAAAIRAMIAARPNTETPQEKP